MKMHDACNRKIYNREFGFSLISWNVLPVSTPPCWHFR